MSYTKSLEFLACETRNHLNQGSKMEKDVKPFIKLKNKTLEDLKSWLDQMGAKSKISPKAILYINGFGDNPITIKLHSSGKFTMMTPLGSLCYIDTVNFSRRHLHFYYMDYFQFSTEKFNV